MRILHLTRDLPPRPTSGLSIATELLVAAGRARGEAHAVVSFDAWRPRAGATSGPVAPTHEARADGVEVVRLGNGADAPAAVGALARVFGPDATWIHDGMLAGYAPPGVPRVQVVHVLAHAQDRLRGTPPTATTAALDAALHAAARVVVTTRAARDLLVADVPTVADRIDIVPLTPDLPHRPRAADAASGPIVMVGRFDALKGTDLVAAALPELLRLRPVVLAGGLPENARAERRWARRLVGAERVGWLDRQALADLLARASLFVAPSRLETCGLALLEALAAGVPVVASDLAAHRELAARGAGRAVGFFVSGDARALIDAARLVIAPDSR